MCSSDLARENYLTKFRSLAEGVLPDAEIERFLDVAQRLPELTAAELDGLTVFTPGLPTPPKGLF